MSSVTQDYAAWNGGVISKKQTGNNTGRSGSSLVGGIIMITAWMNQGTLLEISVNTVPKLKSQAGQHIDKSLESKHARRNLWHNLVVVL
jgi:hypothetical protein